jgi:predicted AAA+ superfamily ATPase
MKRISMKQIKGMIAMDNPWLKTPLEITRLKKEWVPRAYLDLLYPLVTNIKLRRSVVLLGPRRVGKTVLIHHVIEKLMKNGIPSDHICYFSIDHPVYTGLHLEELLDIYSNISGVDIRREEVYVFYDEIQYLKDWERHLKSMTDRFDNIKITVSGSAAAALRLKSLESGAGRFTDFLLPPLTFYEFMLLRGENKIIKVRTDKYGFPRVSQTNLKLLNRRLLEYVNFGGYPEVLFSPDVKSDPGRFIRSDIIDKVLLRDLPSLYGIQDIQELNSLFLTLAFNTANEVSLDALSQGSGLAKNTIKRYVEYLEAAFLIKTVLRVDKNAKRFRRANFFKIYLTNPSMWSALFSPVSAKDEAFRALVETAIFSQWFHSDRELHYARWKKGEVDIVDLDKKKQKAEWALEVKWSDRHLSKSDDLKCILDFCRKNNIESCVATTITGRGAKLVNDTVVFFTPASVYCYVVGYNLIKRKGDIISRKLQAKHKRKSIGNKK